MKAKAQRPTFPKLEITGREAVTAMREGFLRLAHAYTVLGQHNASSAARRMAVEIEKFVQDSELADIEWPARVVGTGLARVERALGRR